MKNWKLWGALLCAVMLASCGGGGGSAGSAGSGGETSEGSGNTSGGSSNNGSEALPVAASIEILSAKADVPSDGSAVLLTAVVKDASNVAIAGAPLSISASSGTLQNFVPTTNTSGVATASLNVGNDPSLRSITVVARSGAASTSLVLPVKGTVLNLTGNFSYQTGASVGQMTVQARDAAGKAIAGKSLAISSQLGNLASTTLVTNSEGTAVIEYVPQNAGTDIISVKGLGISLNQNVSVGTDPFVVLAPTPGQSLPVGTDFTVRVRFTGANLAGRSVNFSSTRGTVTASSTTNQLGEAVATIRSEQAGLAAIQAELVGLGVNAIQNVSFVSAAAASVTTQAQPSTVMPNALGQTQSSSEVRARVVDAFGNPVSNAIVAFNISDPSNGSIDAPRAVTDINGYAKVIFYPGANSTAADAVSISASIAGLTNTARLTVSGSALFMNIAFGNDIGSYNDQLYKKTYSVYVTDANGVAVRNQALTIAAIPSHYFKGFMAWDADSEVWDIVLPSLRCSNEDVNRNGILDAGEDVNRNGKIDPGNVVGVNGVSSSSSVVTTNNEGVATFDIIYGENYAGWIELNIIVKGLVAGTESTASLSSLLEGVVGDYNKQNVAPAARFSPFGVAVDTCTNPN